jgi:hypothetical protein
LEAHSYAVPGESRIKKLPTSCMPGVTTPSQDLPQTTRCPLNCDISTKSMFDNSGHFLAKHLMDDFFLFNAPKKFFDAFVDAFFWSI